MDSAIPSPRTSNLECGRRARLAGTIVGSHATVGEGVRLNPGTVVGAYSTVT